MNILVLNCGSSSVKYQLISMDDEKPLAAGIVERIGTSNSLLKHRPKGKNEIREVNEILNHEEAISLVFSMLKHPQHGVVKSLAEIHAIGHRVVHGGEEFSGSVIIDDMVIEAINKCSRFAPLHNPHNLKGIEICKKLMPSILQAGIFDTAFHQKMPQTAYLYGLPVVLYKKLGVRRYGFHGTSHKYVTARAEKILDVPIEKLKLISCHLGNGASIAAVDGGVSVDTSMGFTPLEGLVMGTRSGDIDPAIIPYLMEHEHLNTQDVEALINKRSGLLGLTETSNDMREIVEEMKAGSEQHRLAFEIFCFKIRKYLGAYMAELNGADGIIFTGGIGENSAEVREKVLLGLEFMGIVLDKKKNRNIKGETMISRGAVKVIVIPTNEELAIARDTKKLVEDAGREAAAPIPEDVLSTELASLTREDKAALVLLWAETPGINEVALANNFRKKTGKMLHPKAISMELEVLGLIS